MSELMILGSRPVSGTIQVAGAKNAVLPEMAACLLTNEDVVLYNVPQITDVEQMKKNLQSYGVKVTGNGTSVSPMILNASNVRPKPQYADGTDIRASFLVAGPLVARFQEQVHVYSPNGCAINKKGRPVDYHIKALEEMGAKYFQSGNIHVFTAENGLHAEEIVFPKSSVGATENIMMAACLVKRETRIKNAAVEPEVIDLADMLKKMGADVTVDKEGKMITIRGNGKLLSRTTHTVIPDRIEAGTYAIAAAIVGGPLLLKMNPEFGQKILVPVIEKLKLAGVQVTPKLDGLEIKRSGQIIKPVSITTGPFPAFPTDLLPQWATFMTQAQGPSTMKDTIYDGRFNHFNQLQKMGASFSKKSDTVYQVNGPVKLRGTHVKATDLRAGMALILAGLAAEGTTVVKEIKHVRRGYGNLKENLEQCGAKFEELRQTRPGFYGFSQY